MAGSALRIRALGSARRGTEKWKLERLTAIANAFLAVWFVASMVALSGGGYTEYRAWLGGIFNATMMVLLVISSFWHAKLGIEVIIEDYVHHSGIKFASLVALNLLAFAFATSCIVAILVIAAGS